MAGPSVHERNHCAFVGQELTVREFRLTLIAPRQVDVGVTARLRKIQNEVVVPRNPPGNTELLAMKGVVRVAFKLPAEFAQKIVFFVV
jgi:hypothetical protein